MKPLYWAAVWAVVRADLRREWRGREVLGLMLPFALALGVALNFTFSLALEQRTLAAVGALWTALLFAMLLGLGRSFTLEQENGAWEGLSLAPLDPGILFSAKLAVNLVLLAALEVVALPVFSALYNLPLLSAEALASVGLGTLALGAAGTLFVPLAGNTRARDLLLPLLLLPLLVPVMVGAVQATATAIASTGITSAGITAAGALSSEHPPWLGLLAACAALFVGGGYLFYGQLLGE